MLSPIKYTEFHHVQVVTYLEDIWDHLLSIDNTTIIMCIFHNNVRQK